MSARDCGVAYAVPGDPLWPRRRALRIRPRVGICGNTRGICRGEFDALILDTLRSGMMDAELLAAFQKVSLGVEWFDRSGGRRPSGQSVPPHSIARSADLSMLAEAAGA